MAVPIHVSRRASARRRAASVLAFGIAAATLAVSAAHAQFLFGWPRAPAPVYERVLSPREIAIILQDHGYAPLGRPRLNGDVYVVEGRDPRGFRIRVLIDAFDGVLISRTILAVPRDRARDSDDLRPPSSIPGSRREAARPSDADGQAPGAIPAPKPAETAKPKPKPPATAARSILDKPDVKPVAPAIAPVVPAPANPGVAVRPPAQATRPSPSLEPLPAIDRARPVEEAPKQPAAAAAGPSVIAPSGPAPGASVVPPALLDEAKPPVMRDPPPMVPPAGLE